MPEVNYSSYITAARSSTDTHIHGQWYAYKREIAQMISSVTLFALKERAVTKVP